MWPASAPAWSARPRSWLPGILVPRGPPQIPGAPAALIRCERGGGTLAAGGRTGWASATHSRGARPGARRGPGADWTSRGRLSTTVRRSFRAVRKGLRRVVRDGGVGRGRTALLTAPTAAGEGVLVDLEVGPDRGRLGVGRQHDQWRAALGRFPDPGDRVAKPAALMGTDDAHPPGHPGVGVGHRGRAALVPGGGEGHPGQAQGIGHLEVAAADDAEDMPDAELRQGPADELGDGRRCRLHPGAGGSKDGAFVGPGRPAGPRLRLRRRGKLVKLLPWTYLPLSNAAVEHCTVCDCTAADCSVAHIFFELPGGLHEPHPVPPRHRHDGNPGTDH